MTQHVGLSENDYFMAHASSLLLQGKIYGQPYVIMFLVKMQKKETQQQIKKREFCVQKQ